jgi:hypothetical protein
MGMKQKEKNKIQTSKIQREGMLCMGTNTSLLSKCPLKTLAQKKFGDAWQESRLPPVNLQTPPSL